MKKIALFVLAFALWVAPVAAQQSVIVPATMFTQAVAGTANGTTTRIITGVSGKQIYITAVALIPVATSSVSFATGTGTACATGTATPLGPLVFSAGQTLTYGNGNGAVLVVPSGTDLCIAIGIAAAPGTIAYSLF